MAKRCIYPFEFLAFVVAILVFSTSLGKNRLTIIINMTDGLTYANKTHIVPNYSSTCPDTSVASLYSWLH